MLFDDFKNEFKFFFACLLQTAGGWDGCSAAFNVKKEDIMQRLNIDEEQYKQLQEQIIQYIENELVKDIINDTRGWKRYAWILEHRFKEKWGDAPVDTAGKVKEPTIVILKDAKDEKNN